MSDVRKCPGSCILNIDAPGIESCRPIHERVVVLVRTDPEPDDAFLFAQADGSVVQANVDSPDIAFGRETQGGMKRIGAKKGKFLIGEPLNLGRQFLVAFFKRMDACRRLFPWLAAAGAEILLHFT